MPRKLAASKSGLRRQTRDGTAWTTTTAVTHRNENHNNKRNTVGGRIEASGGRHHHDVGHQKEISD
jgi:hypothetical protein